MWQRHEQEAGELGLTADQFYGDFAWCQYQNFRIGYYRRRNRETEEHWERTRQLMTLAFANNEALLVLAGLKKTYEPLSPAELVSLPSDPEKVALERQETPEERTIREERFWAQFNRVVDAAEGKLN